MPPKKGSKQDQKPPVSYIDCCRELADGQKAEKKDNVDEAPLQAVILADSYNRRFEVLCSDTPRILLPLCSTPLLTWTLEALSLSKVKQVFVFCGVHANQVREFVA
jgi:translation initiation factor eIF-2B subunit epsilon